MPLAGGATDKVGNRYERRWTVRAMQRLLFGRADILRVEVPGKIGAGAEFRVTIGSATEWTQTKSQTSKGVWTLSNLEKEGFLQDWLPKLRAGERCSFASITSADELRQLCDRAREAVDLDEFKSEFLKDGRDKHLARMTRMWSVDEEEAYRLLKLIDVDTMDEKNLDDLLDLGMRILTGANPKAARNVLLQYADEIVHLEVTAADIWAYLKDNGFNPATPLNQASPLAAAQTQSDDGWLSERLNRFPPAFDQRLRAAMEIDPIHARRLVVSLLGENAPNAVMADWEAFTPDWLENADWSTRLAAADLAGALDAPRLAARLFRRLADEGMPPRHLWLARAAMHFAAVDESEDREDALGAYGGCRSSNHPYGRAVAAIFAGESAEADSHLSGWEPEDPADRAAKAILSVQIALGHPDQDEFTHEAVDAALMRSADHLAVFWFSGLAVWRARSLTLRARQRRVRTTFSDLREAQNQAIRARDERRAWRGDSATPTAIACHAAGVRGDLDFVLRTGLSPEMGGNATPSEAANSAVCEHVAYAAIQLGLAAIAEHAAQRISPGFVRQRIGALIAGMKGMDGTALWREAVDLADNDEHLVQGLAGLAKSGVIDLPRLEELRQLHPESAEEIEAVAALAVGQPDRAIIALRARRRESLTAALTLADAYKDVGDVEAAVQTLLDAGADFADPQPLLLAAGTLAREGRREEAEHHLAVLLGDSFRDWPERVEALKLAAQLAFESSDLRRGATLARTALEADAADSSIRWALLQALIILDQQGEAWSVMSGAPEPLQPTSIGQARLWVELHRRHDTPDKTMQGCLDLLDKYTDDEEFAAFSLTAMMLTGSSELPVHAELQGEYHRRLEAFFHRWPDSPLLRKLSTSDDDELLQALTASLRPTPETVLERRRLTREWQRGEKPLVLLAAYTGRTYAEILIRRGMGTLPSKHPDRHESDLCVQTVLAAINRDVCADMSGVAGLAALPPRIRDKAVSLFRRVLTTDDVSRDLSEYTERLARDAGTLYYDPENDRPAMSELSDDDKRLIRDQIRKMKEVLALVDRRSVQPSADVGVTRLRVHTSVLQLAATTSTSIWCDDTAARAMARTIGIATFSTYSVVDCLVRTGALPQSEQAVVWAQLVRERIGDPQPSTALLLEIARDEGWQLKAAAATLARPQAWERIEDTSTLVSVLLKECNRTSPERVPAWLNTAIFGAALRSPNTRSSVEIAALLLAGNLLSLEAYGEQASQMVHAARTAVHAALSVDAPVGIPTDPLPAAVKALRVLLTRDSSPNELVPKTILGILSGLDRHDLSLVTAAILAKD